MRRTIGKLLATALLFGLATPLGAQVTAIKLEPIDDWAIAREGDLCTATRHFGNSAAPTKVQLRNRDPWNGGFHVAITSDGFRLEQQPFTAGWLPGGRFVTISRPDYETNEGAQPTVVFDHGLWDGSMPRRGEPEYETYWGRLDDGEIRGPLEFKQSVESFLVNGAFNRPLLFATGPMDGVFEARDVCIQEVLAARGIDPADERRDTHVTDFVNQAAVARYIFKEAPDTVRIAGTRQHVSFLLYLDAERKITACQLTTLPYDAEYEAIGCETLRERAQFRFKDGETARPSFHKVSGRFDP